MLKPQWKCPENCEKSDTVVCRHLQKLLPQENPHSLKAIYNTEMVENMPERIVISNSGKEQEMRKKLKVYNLDVIRIEVLIRRFVYNWTFAEIADDLHIPSRQAAFYIYKSGLDLLRERSFK